MNGVGEVGREADDVAGAAPSSFKFKNGRPSFSSRRSSINIVAILEKRELESLPPQQKEMIRSLLHNIDVDQNGRVDSDEFASLLAESVHRTQEMEQAVADSKLKAQEAHFTAEMGKKHLHRMQLMVVGLVVVFASVLAASFGINVAADNATKEMKVDLNGGLRSLTGAEVKTGVSIPEIKPVNPAGEDPSNRSRRLQTIQEICSKSINIRLLQDQEDGTSNTNTVGSGTGGGTSLGCFGEDAVGNMESAIGSTVKIETPDGENNIVSRFTYNISTCINLTEFCIAYFLHLGYQTITIHSWKTSESGIIHINEDRDDAVDLHPSSECQSSAAGTSTGGRRGLQYEQQAYNLCLRGGKLKPFVKCCQDYAGYDLKGVVKSRFENCKSQFGIP